MYKSQIDIRRIKRYIFVYTYDGITVKWDGESYVSVSLPEHYKNKVCGLCGNYNGDPKDEFILPNGVQVRLVWREGNILIDFIIVSWYHPSYVYGEGVPL